MRKKIRPRHAVIPKNVFARLLLMAQTFDFCTPEERGDVHTALMDAWLWGEAVSRPARATPAATADTDEKPEEDGAGSGDMLTIAEASRHLGVPAETIRSAMHYGKVAGELRKGRYYISRADLDEWDKNRINRQYSKPKTVTK